MKLMKSKIIALCLLITLLGSSNNNVGMQVPKESSLPMATQIAAALPIIYLNNLSAIYCHELGHKIALKTLLNVPSKITTLLNPLMVLTIPMAMTVPLQPYPRKGWKTALMAAAGPMSQIGHGCLVLGLSKYLPNSELGSFTKEVVKGISIVTIGSGFLNFVPHAGSDGAKIIDALT